MKKILLSAVAAISITTATMAQTVPNYVPTNGLVGWWPFNGNANDESGNNNNGTVNGATLTADRFGNANKAYSFLNSTISIEHNPNLGFIPNGQFTISFWFYKTTDNSPIHFMGKRPVGSVVFNWQLSCETTRTSFATGLGPGIYDGVFVNTTQPNTTWKFLCGVYDNGNWKLFENGILVSLNTLYSASDSQCQLTFGNSGGYEFFEGKLDDIGIWNRALTQQEITALYQSCNLTASISPTTALLNTGVNAQFTASSADPSSTYQWQTNADNIGWLNVPTNNFYSGATSNSLSVNNPQLGNHNQPFRVIATAGNCVDTSNIATITIADTCINNVTIYDTVTTYISVTDTLFIDINTVGLNNNSVVNTIKVFPNPSNSILNLNYGNYATLNNYRVKIANALSQIIYDQLITQQIETLDLSTFGGNGIYYLNILNPQGNVVEVRKIVLQ